MSEPEQKAEQQALRERILKRWIDYPARLERLLERLESEEVEDWDDSESEQKK